MVMNEILKVEENKTIEEWNNNILVGLLPDSAVLILYIITGATGNILVLFMYNKHLTTHSFNRQFIPALAWCDLAVCVVAMPFSLSINLMPVTFTEEYVCKCLHLASSFLVVFSMELLLVVAIQRYLKICRPFGKQLNKTLALIVSGCLSLLIGVLAFFSYGTRDVWNSHGIRGKKCTNADKSTWVSFLFRIIACANAIFTFTLLILMYTLIAIKLRKRKKSKVSTLEKETFSVATSTELTQDKDTEPKNNTFSRQQIKRKKENKRFTMLFVIMSLILFISLLPKFVLVIIEGKNENFWLLLPPSEMSLYRILYHVNYINNIANPFIYGFLDKTFRKKVKTVLKCK